MHPIRRLRAEKGWTLAELEKRSGVALNTLSHIERGERSPQILTLTKIARALGVPVDALTGEDEESSALPQVNAPYNFKAIIAAVTEEDQPETPSELYSLAHDRVAEILRDYPDERLDELDKEFRAARHRLKGMRQNPEVLAATIELLDAWNALNVVMDARKGALA